MSHTHIHWLSWFVMRCAIYMIKKRKKKKHDTAWYKKKLWGIFTKFIKRRDRYQCFTCGKFASGYGLGGGHFITAAVCPPSLYFHEDNVHAQCTHCNLVLEGNHYIYGVKLGPSRVDTLYKMKEEFRGEVWTIQQYQEKIDYYTAKFKKYE